jgi:hypothetical protein
MNITQLKTACVCGLLLIALSALPSPAGAEVAASTRGRSPGSTWPVPGLGSPATVRGAVSVGRSDVRVAPALAPATQPGGTFEWADASVGAGFALMISLLVAGGASIRARRRVPGQLTAGSGR